MLSKCCEKLQVVLCFTFLITLALSAKLKESDFKEMEVVINNIEEKQSMLKNILMKLILKYTESKSNSTPDPDFTPSPKSDSCVCVPYYQCDENTRKVITDGRFILQSRFGETNRCNDSIYICCERNNINSRISTNDPIQKCGYKYVDLDTNKIDNPNKSKLGEFPWTTVIRDYTSYKCVGSLIHPQVILAAAHCTNTTLQYLAVAGKLQLGAENEPFQFQKVKKIIHHPKFTLLNLHYDVGLLVLENPFNLTKYVNTICLPPSLPQKFITNDKKCMATGWGKLASNAKDYERIMKKVTMNLQSHDECQENLRKTPLGQFFELSESFVCASKVNGENLCDGDNGAPLACSVPGYKDRYQQVGALSWGRECNKNPSVFSKISHVRNWIDEQFQLLNFDKKYYTV